MTDKIILYIGGFELPDLNAAAQRVIANAKIFRKIGYTVIFVGIDKSMNKDVPIEETISEFEGFTYFKVRYPTSLKDWFKYLTDISFVSRLNINKPSIIIAYNYPAFALNRLFKWSKRNKIYLISDCTEWYEAQGSFFFRLIKKLDVYYRMKIIHPKLDGLIAISDFLYKYYQSKMQNVVQLPPLVDKRQSKWNFTQYIKLDNCIKLIYAGSPGKGNKDRLDIIIESLAEIKKQYKINFEFKIIGLTKEQYLCLYNLLSIPENVTKNILFMGRMSHTEVLSNIYRSDYQIFIRENNLANMAGFPTKFVEAISCGTPVLTNSYSNLNLYINEKKNGFLLDTSTKSTLTNSLLKPLQINKEDRIDMKKFCESSNTFDYNNYIALLKAFLINVLK